MSDQKQIITGYASLKGTGGKSITDKEQLPTTKTIKSLTPAEDLISTAMGELQMAGFHCDYQAPIISLQGAASLFEQFFQMDLEIKKQDKGFYAVAKTKAVIPTQLKNIVTDIVFPEPVELF